jgi:RNA polymerase sigma-70 factor (ECF subfamily)
LIETKAKREEFEALLKPVLGLAYRYAVRLAGNRDGGMDLVQDASVAAYTSFHQFEPETSFRAWFLKILTHRYYRVRDGSERRPVMALDEVPELFLYSQAKRQGISLDGDPLVTLLGNLDGAAVCAALDRLPDEYRVVATLHFMGETSYQECAEALDLPIGTVRSRLHRARKLLQVALWRIAEERGYVTEERA